VWGPPQSFIEENNALALATIMTIPLLAYFYIMSTKRWIRAAIVVSIVLCAASALGSYSRGGLLAIIAMSAFLLIKAKSKLWLGLVVVLLGLGFYSFMPPAWEERMNTISTYEEDRSAMGRISAWTMLTNLALDRPLVGGGFEPYTHETYRRYLPGYGRTHSAHSIYFSGAGRAWFCRARPIHGFLDADMAIKPSHHQTHKERSAVKVGVLASGDDSGEFGWLLRRRHVP
jgi:probable O-glycosylation ligase (exosortase A-associated)